MYVCRMWKRVLQNASPAESRRPMAPLVKCRWGLSVFGWRKGVEKLKQNIINEILDDTGPASSAPPTVGVLHTYDIRRPRSIAAKQRQTHDRDHS